MRIPSDISSKMNKLLTDEKLKQRIIEGDSEAIRELGLVAHKTFTAEEIINYNNENNLGELVAKAAHLIELRGLYRDLYNIYCLNARYEEAMDQIKKSTL